MKVLSHRLGLLFSAILSTKEPTVTLPDTVTTASWNVKVNYAGNKANRRKGEKRKNRASRWR